MTRKVCKCCGKEINLTISNCPDDVCWGCLAQQKNRQKKTEDAILELNSEPESYSPESYSPEL